jgi:YVTN family beta-propeller protein
MNGAMLHKRTLLSALALVLASACSRDKAAPAPGEQKTSASAHDQGAPQTPGPAGPLIYVSDEIGGNIVAVDPASAAVVATIPVGKRPRGIKLSRDGKLLYVAVTGSPLGGPNVDETKLPPADRNADGIGVVDLAARKLVRVLKSGQDPESFDVSPDGKTLYVSNEETAEMSVLDLATGEIRGKVRVGREPEGVTVRPDGKVVYVTSEEDSEVTAVDTGTLAVLGHMQTAKRPRSIVFAKDGNTAFAADEVAGVVNVLDTGALKVVDSIKIQLTSPSPAPPRPMSAVLSADGQTLYVSCGRSGAVAVIDVATRKQVRSMEGIGERPWGIGLSSDGTKLYTANGTGKDMSVIDVATGKVDKRVPIGHSPWGLIVAP